MPYHAAMRGLLRQSLIWMLAVALIVAGLPLAHAQTCDTALVVPSQHTHHDMQMDVAGDQMAMNHAAMMHHAPSPRHDNGPAAPLCKCLNCSTLCAAFVAPLPHAARLDRRVVAIVYVESVAARRDTAVFIDPGIPIAA